MRNIEIVVAGDGTLKIEAIDFQGPDCERATRFLEEALGQAAERRRKPAYHARSEAKARQRVGG